MYCDALRYMVLVKGIFKMINIQDTELEQLMHQPLSKRNMFNAIKQFSILDLPFSHYFLLAIVGSLILKIVSFSSGFYSHIK